MREALQPEGVHERRRFDALLALVDRLVEANGEGASGGTPILVEGPRDVAALRALGCCGIVLALKGPIALHDVAHAIALVHKGVILLPDWDRSGLALRDAALGQLHAHGVRCDLHYHERLVMDTDLTMKDVETLPAIVARGLRKFHGRTLEDHVRDRDGDPLGVGTLRDEFVPTDVAPPRVGSARERRPAHKRRARPDDDNAST